MRCVIVAAGMSSRLRPLTDALPKCLLKIGGKTILERTVENLLGAGAVNIALVVGFEAEQIRSFLRQKFPEEKFRFILNPNFATTNNAYSLLLAGNYFLQSGVQKDTREHLLILDSDVVFHPHILQLIGREDGENGIAVRVEGGHDAEEVRVTVNETGHVTKIGKDVDVKNSYGESIGIEWFDHETGKLLFAVLEKRVRAGKGRLEYYEESFQEMIDRGVKCKAVNVGDIPVVEIDSQADLAFAEQSVVPRIDSVHDVRI